MEVGAGLGVDDQVVGAGLGEVLDVALGLDDHQVHVEEAVVALRTAFTTTGPMVMLGT